MSLVAAWAAPALAAVQPHAAQMAALAKDVPLASEPLGEGPGARTFEGGPRFRAFIGLGGNLGEVESTMRAALRVMHRLPGTRVEAVSPLYRSKPVDASGPDFFNAVAVLTSALGPRELLASLHWIELGQGRERSYQNAPRTLDLDLLWFGNAVRQSPELTLPHPRMLGRAFVVQPLADVLGHYPADAESRLRAVLPGAEIRAELARNQGIERVF